MTTPWGAPRSPDDQARHREQNRAWHWKRKARGLCNKCGLSLPPNYKGWLHFECAQAKNRAQRARRLAKQRRIPWHFRTP